MYDYENEIEWQSGKRTEWFTEVDNFDGRSLQAKTGKNGYFTSLPISPKEHREKEDFKSRNVDSGSVRMWRGDTRTEFVITDDWDDEHRLIIPNKFETTIEKIKANISQSDLQFNW